MDLRAWERDWEVVRTVVGSAMHRALVLGTTNNVCIQKSRAAIAESKKLLQQQRSVAKRRR